MSGESKEYIEREAAIARLRDVYEYEYPTGSGDFDEYATRLVPQALKNLKPADVRPVVRGEWVTVSESAWDGNEYKCSACGWTCSDNEFSDDSTENYRFCPNCGADMRRER